MQEWGLGTLDLVWEVAEIAKLIGRSERQTFHLCATGEIPARKIGGRWVIERSKLVAVFTGEGDGGQKVEAA